ncbi:glycine C-acetyltransferase [Halovulum dunhuangense]|uniref:2-amino-3-ketobutyrate coenzyme A ligase n=1 Tax=Halovulum dunhuangense TaxID=1505036 RepID=A0A849KPH7_9RHOB|nr:glycine C-acetyltransferase [Halovulum dunhuangense]NNU78953.1 glycine C-acetyltransferase [Halovulum dunhuangense]
MPRHPFLDDLASRLQGLQADGLYRRERVIASPQGATVRLADGHEMINLCANNYLGLSDHPALVRAGKEALGRYGYGMSSVRFICGTQTDHAVLESRLSAFLETEDTILYSSCFDANTGLFETLLDENDAIISDALNHASIIDGIRLCKARRLRYAHADMAELEARLIEAADARIRLIATDGVFSMDGALAKLPEICDLAERHDALVMVDDSHAVGFIGPGGRGTPAHFGVADRVHILTGTLGKALGGASGGYTSGPKEVIAWLRQRSRPYLFSNALAPVITAASLRALDLIAQGDGLRARLEENTRHFRARMNTLGFELLPGSHPIIPVMLRDPKLAQAMAAELGARGVFVAAFSFPVVPRGQDRIRTQMSAAHDRATLDRAIDAFGAAGRKLGVVS